MSDLKNYRSFLVTPLPQTYTKPNRVKITEERFDKKETKVLSYDTNAEYMEDRAKEYLREIGINLIGRSSIGTGKVILLSDNWGEDYINLDGTRAD